MTAEPLERFNSSISVSIFDVVRIVGKSSPMLDTIIKEELI